MKKILITGACRGLGKHLNKSFCSKGYYVYGTTRTVQNSCELDNNKLLYLDFTDKQSIIDVVNFFQTMDAPLDAIVHNAGIAYLDPIEIMDEEEYRQIFEVNFFGPIYLTRHLLPYLKKSNQSNLIFISSIVSIDCWPYLGAYSASKRAIESVAFEWAALLKQWNIDVSVIQPNPLPTDMTILRSKNMNKSPYPELKNRQLEWESIEDTINIIYEILESRSPKFLYQTGKYSKQTASKFISESSYQNALENYQQQFVNMFKYHKTYTERE